ncbi:hypothetical protein I4F81_001947 [Pyropia yezoensis]|uniref:Uncharacterized protein n=1 Tax=Pyropia yezoensis TaxID=2788 RepID=A0ACC3BN08_PYRYE|nr:hypothetical protein I4F81_001947 [Neopyropia yezoensis]
MAPALRAVVACVPRVPPVAFESEVLIPARTYPVCNASPGGVWNATVEAWKSTVANKCDVEAEVQRQCGLTRYTCCTEVVVDDVDATTVTTCDLESGLCAVLDQTHGAVLIGAAAATGCATEGTARTADDRCQCLKVPAPAGTWAFPTPCVLLLRDHRLVDGATGRPTVDTAPFGPYLAKALTRPRTDAVVLPGDEPPPCIRRPPRPNVRTCVPAAAAVDRVLAVFEGCVASLEPGGAGDGSPGQCCLAPIRDTNSFLSCLVGGDCVRVADGLAVLNDAAALPGCVTVGEAVQPPGAGTSPICPCVVGAAQTAGCVAVGAVPREAPPAIRGGCVAVASGAGGGLPQGGEFAPSLDVCAA